MFKHLFRTKGFCTAGNSLSSVRSSSLTKDLPRGTSRRAYDLREGDRVGGFKVENVVGFKEFQMSGYSLLHEKTGAKYHHIDSADMNNAFAVHFGTPAFDNTGVFHILEHLALCGSKNFPVRDPFFNMIKRSLNSYMNAWTGPDFTMYPFATQNAKDFNNLREVYLDATFRPKLDHLDFLQEGWRKEFLDNNNRNSGLVYKGVVFNEMKGDMSRQDSYFIHKLMTNLFDDSTYKFNSGGDPRFIPQLKYENLLETHRKYYNPSNCKFVSYGDLDFVENLKFLEDNLLQKFVEEKAFTGKRFLVGKARPFDKPREVFDYYQPDLGVGSEEEGLAKVAVAYVCNDLAQDNYETFKMSVLSSLLFEGPNSVMFKKLIESGLAPGYCHGYGLDTSLRQTVMTFGVQNVKNDYKIFKDIEDAIMEGLKESAEKGFKFNLINEVLHMIEYDSKKPRDDFGVNFFNQSTGFITHSDYPFPILHINEYSDRFQRELQQNPIVLQEMIQSYFLENNHRLKLVLRPKEDLVAQLNRDEFESLGRLDKKLTNLEAEKIMQNAETLVEHQSQVQDMGALPSLDLEDIPPEVEKVPHRKLQLIDDVPLYFFEQPTNGISFVRLRADIQSIPDNLKEYVPLYEMILPRLGTKNINYDAFQNQLHTNSSGVNIYLDAFTDKNGQKENENLIFEVSFLDKNLDKALDLYAELFSVPNFFDLSNLNQLIKEESVRIANEIVNNSLDYAISYASAGLKSYKRTYEKFKSDMFICKLGAELLQLATPRDLLQKTAQKLYMLHCLVMRSEALQAAINGSGKHLEGMTAKLNLLLNAVRNENEVFDRSLEDEQERPKFVKKHLQTVITTPSQVKDCVEVFSLPHYNHQDYPKCVVLSHLLGLNFFHKEIREKGGAYGAGASPSDSGLCVFYSFRDPNLNKTFLHFECSLLKVREGKFTDSDIKEAKLFTFARVDRIVNPGDKGLSFFLRGLSEQERNTFRKRLLAVSKDDVMEACNKYFIPQLEDGTTSRVVFGNKPEQDELEEEPWEVQNSLDFLSEKYFEQNEEES